AEPVQLQLDAALDQAMSTADQLNAVAVAKQAWDDQLNRPYRQLQQQLPEESAKALRESQRAWLRFREVEHAALQAHYADVDGSLHRVTHAMDRSRLLQHRVAELQGWAASLQDQAAWFPAAPGSPAIRRSSRSRYPWALTRRPPAAARKSNHGEQHVRIVHRRNRRQLRTGHGRRRATGALPARHRRRSRALSVAPYRQARRRHRLCGVRGTGTAG